MKLRSFDQKEIYIHEWLDVKDPKGIVQIFHGMTEHGKRYDAFAKYLNQNGYLVVADDHRGHGNTDADHLGYSMGNMFDDTVRDEHIITKFYQKKFPGLKYFIFGFSFGSFLAQSYIGKYSNEITGAIIGGSSYKKDAEVYLGYLVASLGKEDEEAKLLEELSFGQYAKNFEDGEWLSNDAENNAAYKADPLAGFTCTNRFYKDFFGGLLKLYTKDYIKHLRKDLPLLIISGADDPVGNMSKGVIKLYNFYTKKAGMTDVELVLFENSRHEFLNEKEDRDLKWNSILSFLNTQVQ